MKLAIVALLLAQSAAAVELHIRFGALERILAEQVFTDEGRRYVKGGRAARCNFAYLETPRIESDGARLRIRAKFTGRSALNLLGQCVGLGDAFAVVITARPVYKDGHLRLADVTAASGGKTGYYVRRVCAGLSAGLPRDFKYPLEDEARKLLEEPGRRELRAFQVPEIRVDSGELVLVIDFQLRVN